MRIKNKVRFTTFIIALMILSGVGGFYIGTAFASEEECEQTPVIIEEPEEEIEEPEVIESPVTIEFEDLGVYTLTAYCGCETCCGQWASDPVVGAGGVELIEGVHCASPLPLGTIVDIEGVGVLEVQDRTADFIVDRYDGKIIDVYFESHEDALKFGKKTARVQMMKEVK